MTTFLPAETVVAAISNTLRSPDRNEMAARYLALLGLADLAPAIREEIDRTTRDADAMRRIRHGMAEAFRVGAIADLSALEILAHHPNETGHPEADVDVVTAAWLADRTLSATGLYAATVVMGGFFIECEDGTDIDGRKSVFVRTTSGTSRHPPRLTVDCPLALHHTWDDGRIKNEDEPDMPETVRSACIGAPLRHVMAHPLLDRFELRLTSWHPVDIWGSGSMGTDAARTPIFRT